MLAYISSLYKSNLALATASVWSTVAAFLFPAEATRLAALAVLIIMTLDLLTKFFALARQNHGFIKAIKVRSLRSDKLAKGTIDKAVTFIVLLIVCGAAGKIIPYSPIAVWLTQFVFGVMFLRDTVSILENLQDAGIDVSVFKHAIKKKYTQYMEDAGGTETPAAPAEKKSQASKPDDDDIPC